MVTLRIGLFGLRGAGKTVALSVAYGVDGEREGLQVTVRDQDTIRYLRPQAEALDRGELPSPTMVADPTRLQWHVRFGEADYELETIDFAGELLDIIGHASDSVEEKMVSSLRAQVREWFSSCDAIILFIDSTDHGTLSYRDALIGLLDDLSKRPTIRGSHQRAVAVVFTKGDQLAGSPEQLSRPGETQRILEGHPLYQVVQRRLAQYAETIQYRAFLSSALGWRFVSIRNRSERKVQPCNLFAAFRWGLEQAVEIVKGTHAQVIAELDQELGERTGSPPGLWALVHSRSLQTMLDATDRDYQLSKGPWAAKFAERRQMIQQARTNQLRGWSFAGLALFLLCLMWGWNHLRQSDLAVYDEYERLGRDSVAHIQEAISFHETRIATRRWDWFWATGDRREAADNQLDQDRRAITEHAFRNWEAEDKDHQEKGRVPHRHLAAKAYMQRHERYAPANRLKAVRQVCDATQPAYVLELKTWNEIVALPKGTLRECERKIARLKQYEQLPTSLRRDEAGNMLKTLEKEAQQKWDRLAGLPTSTLSECQEKCDQLLAYLNDKDACCRQEAQELLHTASMAWYYFLVALPNGTLAECERKVTRLKQYEQLPTSIRREEASNTLKTLEKEAQQKWDRLSGLPTSTLSECQEKCDQLLAYLNDKDACRRQESQELLHTASMAWYKMLAALPTKNGAQCVSKAAQLRSYAQRKEAVYRREAEQWLDVLSEGTSYLNGKERNTEESKVYDCWVLSTGISFNLNPMFAFVDDKWQVRWRKSSEWSLPDERVPPWGKGEEATKKILEKLAELNKKLPAGRPGVAK